MTYNVFGGMLNLNQSINQSTFQDMSKIFMSLPRLTWNFTVCRPKDVNIIRDYAICAALITLKVSGNLHLDCVTPIHSSVNVNAFTVVL